LGESKANPALWGLKFLQKACCGRNYTRSVDSPEMGKKQNKKKKMSDLFGAFRLGIADEETTRLQRSTPDRLFDVLLQQPNAIACPHAWRNTDCT
jgi:hypothetical protein